MAWIRGKLLGAGAFGSVNLAINRSDGEVFAVKSVVVNEGSEVAVRAIENEIRLLQELESKYVVKCMGSDWSEEGGELRRNVFLEYMPEGCLTDFVKQFGANSLDEHLLRTYTRSIVEGIDYLHRRGIVHCDVKGKNVLVGNGSVKLTDFGSAKRVTDATGAVNGTPLWMAPEVVRQVEQGPASDIWSLGCTVVEMATGRAPWSNLAGMNHLVALYHIGCTDDLPAVPETLSADAHDFLSHCLQRDPRQRWTSAQLLQHPFLNNCFVTPAVPASPTSVMEFPDSDCDSFVNSVPTLAAPSLFKRGLVSNATPEPLSDSGSNWPDSGPWIVVRSPKSASSPLSDWMPSSPTVSDEAPVAAECQAFEASDLEVLNVDSGSDLNVSSCDSQDGPRIQIATRFKFCRAGRGVGFSDVHEDEGQAESWNLNLGLGGLINSVTEYSELVYQYSNPRIVLYWWHSYRKWLQRSLRGSSSKLCITIPFLDQYTLPLILAKRTPSQIAFACGCISFCMCCISVCIWLKDSTCCVNYPSGRLIRSGLRTKVRFCCIWLSLI